MLPKIVDFSFLVVLAGMVGLSAGLVNGDGGGALERVDTLALKEAEVTRVTCMVIDHEAGYAYLGNTENSGGARIVKLALGDEGEPPRHLGHETLESDERSLTTALIDPAGGHAYFTASPRTIVKVALGEGDELPTRVGSISLPSTVGTIRSAVIDPDAGHALYGSSNGRVIKVALGEGDEMPSVVDTIVLESGELNLRTAVIDAAAGYAYFGTYSSAPRVIKVALGVGGSPPLRIGATEFPQSIQNLNTSVIDPVNGYAYFGTYSSLSRVAKVALGEGDVHPQYVAQTIPTVVQGPLRSSSIDVQEGYALFGTDTDPALILKVRLGSGAAAPSEIGATTMNPRERNLAAGAFDPLSGDSYFATGHDAETATHVIRVSPGEDSSPPERLGALRMGPGEDSLRTAAINVETGHLYVTTARTPARVVKVAVGDEIIPPARIAALELEVADGTPNSAVLDPVGGHVYYGAATSPGKVIKIALGDGDEPPWRVGDLILETGEDNLSSAVIDADRGYALFGTFTIPGQIIKVRLGDGVAPPSRVGAIELPAGENRLISAIYHDGYAWFGTSTGPGRVVKVAIGNEDELPVRLGTLQLQSPENSLAAAVIDADNGLGYFGTSTEPGRVIKVKLGLGDELPTQLGTLRLSDRDGNARAAVIDPSRRRAWFAARPASTALASYIVEVDLGDGDDLPAHRGRIGASSPTCAAIDAVAGYAYIGSGTSPGRIDRLRLGIGHSPDLPPNCFFPGQEIEHAWGDVGGTTLFAVRQPGEPAHAGVQGTGTVWYSWTAPYSARVEFSTCDASASDTVLDVYTGDFVHALTRIGSTLEDCEIGVRKGFHALEGTTYRIAVAHADGETGPFMLAWALAPVVVFVTPEGHELAPASPTFAVAGTSIGEPTEIRWRIGSDGAWSPAAGSPQEWTFLAPLEIGPNTVQVQAIRFGTTESAIAERVLTRVAPGVIAPQWTATLRTPVRVEAKAVTMDGDGNIYVVGDTTGAISASWPIDPLTPPGGDDGFVMKLDTEGGYVWHRYIGGWSLEYARGVAVGDDGSLYIVGTSGSRGFVGLPDFSTSFRRYAAYLLKMDADGQMHWVRFIEPEYPASYGTYDSQGAAVAIDASGDVFIAGHSVRSESWTPYYEGPGDGFVARFAPNGTEIWREYLGGDEFDRVTAIDVDFEGSLLVAGTTKSSEWVSGGWDTEFNGKSDGFVAKLGPTGQHIWSTYLGGPKDESAFGIAVDHEGNVAVTGWTNSEGWVSGGANTFHEGGLTAFVAKLDTDGNHLWSTYLGGRREDVGHDIAIDAGGAIYVTGQTSSDDWARFGWNTHYVPGLSNAFAARLSPSGQHLWSSYFGNGYRNQARGIAVDDEGGLILTGIVEDGLIGWREALILKVVQDFDAPAPMVAILDPSSDVILPHPTTSRSVSGTASAPDSELVAVEWRRGEGDWENAHGTTAWDLLADELSIGENPVHVRALNAQGTYGAVAARSLIRMAEVPTLGDLNDDLIVNVVDVTLLANMIAAGNPPPPEVGDINGDGVVNELDVQALAEMVVE